LSMKIDAFSGGRGAFPIFTVTMPAVSVKE
jgi:hypothetical protein